MKGERNMTNIRLYDRRGKEVVNPSYDRFEPDGQAVLTNRVLDCDMECVGMVEEWMDSGIYDGLPCFAYYLFDQDEIDQATRMCPDNPPEEYPWDKEHCWLIIITDN